MKRLAFSLFAVLTAVFFFSSCGDQDQHILLLDYPSGGVADSIDAAGGTDSICFVTADAFRVSSSESWCTPLADSVTIPHDATTRYYVVSRLKIDENTTGEPRSCVVTVKSYDYQIQAIYIQKAAKKTE